VTTFKTGSVLFTGSGVGDTQPGFLVTFASSHPAGQASFAFLDYQNAPIFTIPDISNGAALCYGDDIGARHATFDTGSMRVDGVRNPAPLLFPDSVSSTGMKLWSGGGLPTRTVTDLVTNGTTTITSATASFSSSTDVGMFIVGSTNITNGTRITSVTNSTTAVISATATGSGSGGTLTLTKIGGAAEIGDLYIRIDSPTTSNQRIYQCTMAGTPGTWTARF
jgi:hypothetical protein